MRKNILLENEIFSVEEEKLNLTPFYRLICPDWVNVIGLTKRNEVVFVIQHRFGINEETIEIPGGQMDKVDKNPKDAAKRELLEESGYGGGKWTYLGFVHPNPAILNNKCHSFLARNVEKIADIKNDLNEKTEVVLIPIKEINNLILKKKITHSLVLNAFQLFFLKKYFLVRELKMKEILEI